MAIGPEEEIPAMAPGRAVTWAARLSRRAAPAGGDGDPTTASGPGTVTAWAELDEAADLLALAAVDVVGYASTSSAYAIGFEAEVAVVSRLSRRVGVPAAATCAGCVQALRVLGIERVALVHPPWFDVALNQLGALYYETQGFDVVSSASAALPRDPRCCSGTFFDRRVPPWGRQLVQHPARSSTPGSCFAGRPSPGWMTAPSG
jgi:maleate isomerase